MKITAAVGMKRYPMRGLEVEGAEAIDAAIEALREEWKDSGSRGALIQRYNLPDSDRLTFYATLAK